VSLLQVQSVCEIGKDPIVAVDCLTLVVTGLTGVLNKDYKKLCQAADRIAICLQAAVEGCLGETFAMSALQEVSIIAKTCCPDKNGRNCSYKEPFSDGNQKCFSSDSLASLVNGKQKRVSELIPGDRVYAIDSANKNIIQTDVIAMLDNEPTKFALFKSLRTSSGRELSLSFSHLIPTKSPGGFLMAKHLQNGMELYVMNEDLDVVVETIINITDVVKEGYTAPMTKEGTIVVNNVAVSCYATVQSHMMAHVILAPMRWWYSFSSMLPEQHQQQQQLQRGVHWFPNVLFKLTSFMWPSIVTN